MALGADWSWYNPPLLFFFFFLLVNFQSARLLNCLAGWLGGRWGWHKEMVGSAEMESAIRVFPAAVCSGLAEAREGCGPTVVFMPCNPPQMLWEGQGRQLPWDGVRTFLCSFERKEKGFNYHLLKNGAMRKTHLIYMQVRGFPVVFRPKVFMFYHPAMHSTFNCVQCNTCTTFNTCHTTVIATTAPYTLAVSASGAKIWATFSPRTK